MLASFRWLKELCPVDVEAAEIAHRLTQAGLEIEAVVPKGEGLDGIVVAEVRASRSHPDRDKLSLVTVFDGEVEREVVCGASNVPEPGGRVLFARPGSVLPNGTEIRPRKVGGIESAGMICSEVELDIGADADGIFVVEPTDAAKPGEPISEALQLRDTIFDIGLTPNRPDCLGHVGIAREMALLLGKPWLTPALQAPAKVFAPGEAFASGEPTKELRPLWSGESLEAPSPSLSPVSVRIEDAERCPRYGAALVHGVKVGPSPFWLRYRLHNLGLRALSNVVDVTNLVLLEWGHPIHGFDLRHLRGSRVVVRLASEGERMATLDGIERTFTSDDLLICDAEGPVAVAGVMGGADSEIRPDTSDVLIECAYFDPRSVRRTSRRLGLHTDSSHRFERGVDPQAVPRVLARAASLIADLGGGRAADTAIDRVAKPFVPNSIHFRPSRASRLLGTAVDLESSRELLQAVGCEMDSVDADTLTARAPSWRPDLLREVDLIEEVARVRGYDQIETAVPKVHPSVAGTAPFLRFTSRLRSAAAEAGLFEAVNFGFVSREDLRKARVSERAVPLANPLSEERSVMRTSLLPGLMAAVVHAQRRGAGEIALFELARTFHPSAEALPIEKTVLSIVLAGERRGWIGGDRPFDFYDGKGLLEAVLDRASIGRPELSLCADQPFLHPKRAAVVELAEHKVGYVGELHPDVSDELGLSGRAIYAELDVATLFEAAAAIGAPKAKELPKFPSIARDIAMLVSEDIAAGDIAQSLSEASDGLAESVRLFDLYRGDQVPEGQRSLAFRITYRDPEGTLTDKRVDKVHEKLGKLVRERFQASIR